MTQRKPFRAAHASEIAPTSAIVGDATKLSVVLPPASKITLQRACSVSGRFELSLNASPDDTAIIVPRRDCPATITVSGREPVNISLRAGVLHFLVLDEAACLHSLCGGDLVSIVVPNLLLHRRVPASISSTSEPPSATGRPDPVVVGILDALSDALEDPSAAVPSFCSHVCGALLAHIGHYYFDLHPDDGRRQGLTGRQELTAKRMLMAQIDETVPVCAVATACGLSTSHFIRAFRQTTGLPPHRWLTMQRIEKASEELRASCRSLAEIAYRNGFVDQSHFSRVFLTRMGMSPGRWRRKFGSDTVVGEVDGSAPNADREPSELESRLR